MNKEKRSTHRERVKIWNTVFGYAYSEAAEIKGIPTDWNPKGDKLSDEDIHKLRLLIFLILAIETRASHLVLERVDDNITSAQGESLIHLNFKQQWGLLPLLYQRPKGIKVDFTKGSPHKIINDLKDIRDMLFHADLPGLLSYLNSKKPEDLVQYVVQFWDAMEDMNVLLGRDRRNTSKPEILAMVNKLR